jgi:hypothetical protein
MRDQWEYKMLVRNVVGFLSVQTHWVDADDGTDHGAEVSTELLNRLGQEGWEVCALDATLAGGTLLLKRKKV